MRAIVLALLLVLTTSVEAKAQDWWWQFSYNMGATSGETRDYISQFSFRGMGFQGRRFMNFQNQWSLGFDLSWQVFNETNAGTTALDEERRSAISGTAFKYINAFPILVNAHYYFGNEQRGTTTGFAGVNTGVYYIEQRTEAGLWALTSDAWHFGIAPEVGVGVPAGRTYITGTLRYNWTAKAEDRDYQFWSFMIGIASR
jgi:hypothetical protein